MKFAKNIRHLVREAYKKSNFMDNKLYEFLFDLDIYLKYVANRNLELKRLRTTALLDECKRQAVRTEGLHIGSETFLRKIKP